MADKDIPTTSGSTDKHKLVSGPKDKSDKKLEYSDISSDDGASGKKSDPKKTSTDQNKGKSKISPTKPKRKRSSSSSYSSNR